MSDAKNIINEIAEKALKASRKTATLSSEVKNNCLVTMAEMLVEEKDFLQKENKKDLSEAKKNGLSSAMINRLELTDKVIDGMAEGLRQVAALEDPVGQINNMTIRPNGLKVGKMRIPLGVIGIVYESRPNVTADAAGLCLKSGNAVILRGGKEAINSNLAVASVLQRACSEHGVSVDAIQVVPNTDREIITEMLKLDELIDLIIPRGGEGLIRFVSENSRIPVIKHYKGVCHVFVDKYAEILMAKDIVYNSKVQRPGVCNSLETLLVHKDIAEEFLPVIGKGFKSAGVEVRGCAKTKEILGSYVIDATDDDYHAEFLDLIVAVKVVDGFDEAVNHIEKFGSLHTESIVTDNYHRSMEFIERINSSTVMVNASTRFADGFELGLGAEIGISTSKLHAFGPMGLMGLTAEKFIVLGNGQIRS